MIINVPSTLRDTIFIIFPTGWHGEPVRVHLVHSRCPEFESQKVLKSLLRRPHRWKVLDLYLCVSYTTKAPTDA